MTILNAVEAGTQLHSLIDEVEQTHHPIIITGKKTNAVLLSENDWRAITETLHLLSITGMRESIQSGLAEDIADCASELDW